MKKNVLKKFAAAALAAATVMSSMSVMAFADDTGATAKTGSVTITKCESTEDGYETLNPNYGAVQDVSAKEKLKDVEFAYIAVGDRVQVDVTDANTGKMTTEMLYTLSDEAVTALGLKESDKITENSKTYYRMSTLDTAIRKQKNEVIDLVKKANNNHATPTGADGTVKFEGLSLEKLYLFAETDASAAKKVSDGTAVAVTKVSVPFFVSLPFTDASGKSVKDIYAYPKNSTGNVDIDKEINSVGTIIINGKQANANIGDEITYKVTYSVPVPENGLTALEIVDTMDKGLTFTNEKANITVEDNNVGTGDKKELKYGTEYTVTTEKNIVTIDFEKYLNSLQKNSTETFTITYKVKLNENAVLGQTGNKNKVELVYRNYGETVSKTKTPDPDKEVKVFTYGIDLTKKGEGTDVLEGVKFELTNSENQPVKVLKNGTNNFYTPGGTSNEVTTDNKGEIHIRGLKPGTYKLTETKTKDGYVLLKDPVVIKITPSTNAEEVAKGVVTAYVGTKEVTMNADDNGSLTAKVPLTVVNSKVFDLPATGGRGIALFTIAGIAIVAAAGSLLFMRKRSK